jgi:hypothetical protein
LPVKTEGAVLGGWLSLVKSPIQKPMNKQLWPNHNKKNNSSQSKNGQDNK